MTRIEGIASIILGIIISVIMAGMMSPAVSRLLSVTMADSILH